MRHEPGSAALVLVAALAAAGCPSPPRGPTYAQVAPAAVAAVEIGLAGGSETFCPGEESTQVHALLTLADGTHVETWVYGGEREGRIDFGALEWSSSLGAIAGDGQLVLPPDPFASLDLDVVVAARVVGRSEVRAETTLRARYDCGAVADFSGEAGESGRAGEPGRRGRGGSTGNSSRPATYGEDGQNGQDGGDGRPGRAGPALEVALGLVRSQQHGSLVLARVGSQHFLLDPRGRPLVVAATGGSGGRGGDGGAGGDGGFGGSNDIVGAGDGASGGDGGDGGRGGDGADGGDGGSVVVRYDRNHPELRALVVVDTRGGPGGSPGSGGSGGTPGTGGLSATGQRGLNGRVGVAGAGAAQSGRPGRQGAEASFEPADPATLFADEIARGIAVLVD